jgi:sugar phosphate isomerase/epimerase
LNKTQRCEIVDCIKYASSETWRQAWEQFGERFAVVHLKDIGDGQNVTLGAGEIDLSGVVQQLKVAHYSGHRVVELLVPDRKKTLQYLIEARQLI